MFTSAPLKTSVCGPKRAHLAFDPRLGVREDAAAREPLARPGCPPPPRPSGPPRPAPRRAGGGREGGGGSARGVTKPSRNAEVGAGDRGAPGEPTCGPPSRGGRRERSLPPPPPPLRAPLGRRAGPLRRGRSGAAKRPGRTGSRRKDARALGGGEVIKGKEPAAGGSGRFSCSGRCCLAFGPPEGRSVEGRRCRPQ